MVAVFTRFISHSSSRPTVTDMLSSGSREKQGGVSKDMPPSMLTSAPHGMGVYQPPPHPHQQHQPHQQQQQQQHLGPTQGRHLTTVRKWHMKRMILVPKMTWGWPEASLPPPPPPHPNDIEHQILTCQYYTFYFGFTLHKLVSNLKFHSNLWSSTHNHS